MSLTFAEVLSAVAIAVTFYGVFSQRNYRKSQEQINAAQADSAVVKDALSLKQEYKADYLELKKLFDELSDKQVLLEKELQHERAARGLLETKLIEANQRISALEDELDKREKRIKELESGTFPTVKKSEFGSK